MRILDLFSNREPEKRQWDASLFNLGLQDEGKTSSGKVVDPSTAIQSSAVYSCVSLISDSIATMPIKTYRKSADFREPVTPPLYLNAIDGMPNPDTDLFAFVHRSIN